MSNAPELRDSIFTASDQRANFKNVIAKRSDLLAFKRGRLAPSLSASAQYIAEAGLVLGFAATGPDAGYYKPYNSANTDGSQVAVGVLSEQATVASGTSDGSEIVIVRSGTLYQNLLIGLDAGAITNMSGKSYVEGGNTLIDIRA